MTYLKVRWLHQDAADPVLLLSELDVDRHEVRKIEVFADGRMGFASEDRTGGDTFLGEGPVPANVEIAADPQFVIEAVDAREFDLAWRAAVTGSRWKLRA